MTTLSTGACGYGLPQGDETVSGLPMSDPRHGTTRGHAAGCRELCCRRARNDDEARRRKYRQVLGITRSVDATGTRRRIQALMAIGWPSRQIAARCGWTSGEAVLEVARRNYVYTATAQAIARVYDELCMTPGPSPETKRRAARNGWAVPLAWDDIDTDPSPTETCDDCEPDSVVVDRIVGGDYRLPATAAEKTAVAARWDELGRSMRSLREVTGWKVERYYKQKEAVA